MSFSNIGWEDEWSDENESGTRSWTFKASAIPLGANREPFFAYIAELHVTTFAWDDTVQTMVQVGIPAEAIHRSEHRSLSQAAVAATKAYSRALALRQGPK